MLLSVLLALWSPIVALTSSPGSAGSIVFALLADGHLLAVRAANGTVMATRTLTTAPIPTDLLAAGHYLARSSDGRTLYALVPGDPAYLASVDVATARVQMRYPLARGLLARSLAIGPTTGHLYVFGNRPEPATTPFGTPVEDVVVQVLDPRNGRLVAHWTARHADGHDWYVYQGDVDHDERHLFISYHGPDTTGIDRFTMDRSGLRRCTSASPSTHHIGSGCFHTHGGFTLFGNDILAATGTPLIPEMNQTGRIVRRLDTRLTGNHLMEFVVDDKADRLIAVGPCGYTGGMSIVALARGQTRVLVSPQPDNAICGERFVRGPAHLLVVGKTAEMVPQRGLPGALLFVDVQTGRLRRTVETPAEPLDVFIA